MGKNLEYKAGGEIFIKKGLRGVDTKGNVVYFNKDTQGEIESINERYVSVKTASHRYPIRYILTDLHLLNQDTGEH